MKITIIGNSVALRVRPPEDHPDNKNYTQLLTEKTGVNDIVENKAIGATTIRNWLQMNDQIINSFPDLYIINIGVVDATTREVPLWFYRLATKKIDNFITRLIKNIYRGLISRMRPFFSMLRGSRSWVSIKKFKKSYDELLETLIKETNARIITLPINPADERVEKQLPGSRKNHIKYNKVIEEITKKHNQYFLDLTDLNSEEHYPDGVHFNATGHEIVAEKIESLIKEISN